MSRVHDVLRRLESVPPADETYPRTTELARNGSEAFTPIALPPSRSLKVHVRPESHIVLDTTRNHPVREQFRFIEHRLRRLRDSSRIKRVLVTSSTPKEGKTVVAANLAVTLACSSPRVLLIDADMRGPGSEGLYGLDEQPGLAEVLEQRAKLSDVLLYLENLNFHYIPSGKPASSPADLVNSVRMKELLRDVDEFDWVVVDTPPIGAFADALSLAAEVDTVVLVARSGMTHKRDLEESLHALKDSKIAGVVLNAHDPERKRDSYYTYYSRGRK